MGGVSKNSQRSAKVPKSTDSAPVTVKRACGLPDMMETRMAAGKIAKATIATIYKPPRNAGAKSGHT